MSSFENRAIPAEKKLLEPVLGTEILALVQTDQEARKHWEETGEVWDRNLDRNHAARLKEIIEKIGWPTRSKVGDEASTAAWVLVQHADHDVAFQQACLDLMKLEPKEEVDQTNIAFLEDRVRVNMGKPTLYGTQFDHSKDGEFSALPIEDRENLNERRQSVGLGTFEAYETEMQELDKRLKDPD